MLQFLHVNLDMRPQVGFVREPLGAAVKGARVRLLPGVNSDVVSEQPGAGEGLLAEVALVAPHVGLHVHGQGGHARVELVAHPAAPPLVGVDLTVAGEVAAGGEHLAAVVTRLELLSSGHSEAHLEAVAGVLRVVRHRGGWRGGPGGAAEVKNLLLMMMMNIFLLLFLEGEGGSELEDGVRRHDVLECPVLHGVISAGVSRELCPKREHAAIYPGTPAGVSHCSGERESREAGSGDAGP